MCFYWWFLLQQNYKRCERRNSDIMSFLLLHKTHLFHKCIKRKHLTSVQLHKHFTVFSSEMKLVSAHECSSGEFPPVLHQDSPQTETSVISHIWHRNGTFKDKEGHIQRKFDGFIKAEKQLQKETPWKIRCFLSLRRQRDSIWVTDRFVFHGRHSEFWQQIFKLLTLNNKCFELLTEMTSFSSIRHKYFFIKNSFFLSRLRITDAETRF